MIVRGETIEVTKAKFDSLCGDLFKRCLNVVEKVLAKEKVQKQEINHVLLIGGATRMQKIREMLSEFFCPEIVRSNVNADEAIARGAAICSAIIQACKARTSQVETC